MTFPTPDPSRQQGIWYQKLGPARDPRITRLDEDLTSSDETLRMKLRRQRIVASVIVLVALAVLAGYLILQVLG